MNQNDRNFSDTLRARLSQAVGLSGDAPEREPPPDLLQCLSLCTSASDRARERAQRVLAPTKGNHLSSSPPPPPVETAYRLLQQEEGNEAARRFLGWSLLKEEGRSLFILIGGASGTGKSSIAAALGERIGIRRIQSTDMLREVLRAVDDGPFDSGLHASTFITDKTEENEEEDEGKRAARTVAAFRKQSSRVAPAIQGVLKRAQKEGDGLILEGVHLVPGLPGAIPSDCRAVIIPFLLAVLDPEALANHFEHRGQSAPDRSADHYMDHFEAIWQLQMHLLAQASQNAVQVVQNHTLNETVEKLTLRIGDHLADALLPEDFS